MKRELRTFCTLAFLALAGVGCCPDGLSIDVEGTTRTYQLYMPPAETGKPVPLVIALHPLFLDACQMRLLTRFDAIAEREGFAVVYPDGLARHWDMLFGGDRDIKFITALIDELIRDYDIDPLRVFATGGSNGGMMCHQLACAIPDRIAAIAPVMGTPPLNVLDNCKCELPMPVLIIHGTSDQIVPYDGEPLHYILPSVPDVASFWAARNGCAGEPLVTPLPDMAPDDETTVDLIEYPCGTNAPVQLYCIHGGGHTWAGNLDYLPQLSWGKVSLDMDASEAIWEFFSTQGAGYRPAGH